MCNLLPGARKIVQMCMAVQPGERLLIVTDSGISPRIAQALAEAGRQAGASVTVLTTAPLQHPGDAPPPEVATAMLEADVILAPTSRTLYHSGAALAACGNGARLLALTELTEDAMCVGGIEADFAALQPRVERVRAAFEVGRRVRVAAPGGTDLTLSIAERQPHVCSGLCRLPGQRMGFPDVEVFIAPIEAETCGILVIDASATGIGLMDAPVRITVEKGVATAIEGGQKAAEIREILARTEDKSARYCCGASSRPAKRARTVAEFALGLNDCARVIGNIIEDEGTYGTGHFALGNNIFFGGKNPAPIHFDMVYWKPTVEIDGAILMRNGALSEP